MISINKNLYGATVLTVLFDFKTLFCTTKVVLPNGKRAGLKI